MPFIVGTATDYEDLITQLADMAASTKVGSAAVVGVVGTSGYAIGDVLSVTGGTATHTCTLRVTGVTAGQVDTAVPLSAGAYTALPSNPVSTTIVSGAGVGTVTFNLTGASTANNWTVAREQDVGTTKELVLTNTASNGSTVNIGARSYNLTTSRTSNLRCNVTNWELVGFGDTTPDSGATAWASLNVISTGRYDGTGGGAYLPLTGGTLGMKFWCSIKQNRIVLVARCGAAYSFAHWGFINQFSASVDHPYPNVIMGSTARADYDYKVTEAGYTGPIECIGVDGFAGPGFMLESGHPTTDTWHQITNSLRDVNGDWILGTTSGDWIRVYPIGYPFGSGTGSTSPNVSADTIYTNNGTIGGWFSVLRVIDHSDRRGDPMTTYWLSPTLTDDEYLLVPNALIHADNSPEKYDIYGEMDGVYWIANPPEFNSQRDELFSEDIITDTNGDRYFVFHSGNRQYHWCFYALKEE